MKKYYQAALALTAATSLLALLFYRNEYNKLRFVLQVFNYFGSPDQKAYNCTIHNIPQLTTDSSQFTTTQTSWQRLNDDVYIYSAYDNSDDDDGLVQAIGFGKNVNNLNYYCSVIFDDNVNVLPGKLSFTTIDYNHNVTGNYNDKYSGYIFSCRYSKTKNTIVGVQIFNHLRQKLNAIPIIQVQSTIKQDNRTDNVICVAPSIGKIMRHRDMISFLAFHSFINWNNFIVYDFGISPIFNNALQSMAKLSNNQWNFSYISIPWNFPFAQIPHGVIQSVIETDCYYRTLNRAALAVTLSWDEYINLHYHKSFEEILNDLKQEKIIAKKLQLNTQILCIDKADEDVLTWTPAILRTTRRLRNSLNTNEHRYIYKFDDVHSMNVIPPQNMGDLVYINRYQQCEIDDKRELIDTEILRFAEFMTGTALFQSYITGQLFS